MSRTIAIPHKDHQAIFARVKGPHDEYRSAYSAHSPASYNFKSGDRDRSVSLELVDSTTIEIGSSSTVSSLEDIEAYERAYRFLRELLSEEVPDLGISRYDRLLGNDEVVS